MSSAVINFREKVENLPALLRTALERRAKARIAVARLESQLVKLKAQLKFQGDNEDEVDGELDGGDNTKGVNVSPNPFMDDVLEGDLSLINLESKHEHLKLELTEAEDKAEIEFRASESRVTEGYVKAAVGSNPNVSRLRREVLEAKEAVRIRKVTAQREREALYAEQRQSQLYARFDAPIILENEKLVSLREKLLEAKEELILADVEVEVAEATIASYKMLSQNQ